MSELDKTKAEEAIKLAPDSASKTEKEKREERKEADKANEALNAKNSELVGPNNPPEKAIIYRRER